MAGRTPEPPVDAPAEVRDVPERQRFEALVDGALAGYAEYRLEPGAVVFTHTVVDDAYEGRGVGSRLVRGALDTVVARGLAVVPECPFVRAYLERHPELADAVAGGRPARPGPAGRSVRA